MKNERIICVECLHELPVTSYLPNNENDVKKVFYGRIKVEEAEALLIFQKKGSVQKLIHQLKYRGQKEIGGFLGEWMGTNLKQDNKFSEAEIVIPVPLHKKKLKARGYNQVEGFGKEISKALQIPYVDNVLLKTSLSTTQTIKTRLARWGNIEETFVLANPGLIKDKHVLIVDDLITISSTLEACATVLKQAGGVKISIATMAIAG
ncbi:phosphoribosyltransferase family protein [Antarcticibacterium sp. 1MA-6-2]|uniref:ComF family protein n=1 Tax=Antarcticibacterium sp. 1MA-6-2 TaxID=2908210 RepID=UPI002882F3B8|nr:phosphoribosyltransferase family protein [Antarcticibacterium sp. 1MA-6-2]